MQQILKRLEIIKNSITLEDEETIELQVNKIKSLDNDKYIEDILNKIKQNEFSHAISAIEKYINKNTGLEAFEDQEAQSLKLELKLLERKLENLTEKKVDYTTEIDDFNHEYNFQLGGLIKNLLGLRQDILYQKVVVKEQRFQSKKQVFEQAKDELNNIKKQARNIEEELEILDEFSDEYETLYEQYSDLKDKINREDSALDEKRKEAKQAKIELDDDPVNDEYQEAKEDCASFNKEYEEIKAENAFALNKEEEKELKNAYRKAVKLCHPDIVSDELKNQAHEVMIALNQARKKRDLEKIKEILLSLQSGLGFVVASDAVDDKEILKNIIISVNEKIIILESEIADLESSGTYNTIKHIDDKGEYFADLKNQLEDEAERLDAELVQLKTKPDFDSLGLGAEHAVENEPKPKSKKADDSDEYWTDEF